MGFSSKGFLGPSGFKLRFASADQGGVGSEDAWGWGSCQHAWAASSVASRAAVQGRQVANAAARHLPLVSRGVDRKFVRTRGSPMQRVREAVRAAWGRGIHCWESSSSPWAVFVDFKVCGREHAVGQRSSAECAQRAALRSMFSGDQDRFSVLAGSG